MSELKLISPLLDGYAMGTPMSSHDGIHCCPAMKENTDEKYIVKIISVPVSQTQLDALLLTGAYKDPADAMDYFKEVADGISAEVDVLNNLSKLDGFLPYDGCQIVPMEDGKLGYHIYLLSTYKRSLFRYMRKNPVTHLEAVNLGLDLCASLAICRRAGYLYLDLKPTNIFLSKEKQYRIGDLGFIKLDSMAYASLPGKYRSPYSPPELQDDMKTLNNTVDTYAVGMILYQIYNEGSLPLQPLEPTDAFPHPANADYEIASIIMKALDPDPSKRWTDPMEMGQALVGYMQRNTVNNVPIAPPSGVLVTDPPVMDTAGTEEISQTNDSAADTEAAASEKVSIAEEPQSVEEHDKDSMLTFQNNLGSVLAPQDEDTDSGNAVSNTSKKEDTAVKTEADTDTVMANSFNETADFDTDFLKPISNTVPKKVPSVQKKVPEPVRQYRKPKGTAMITCILVLLILVSVASGAFWFYQNKYLLPIDNLTVTGTQHELTVTVDADMDFSLLQATCTDTYGNSIVQPFVNNQAVFTDLLPDSLYRIELEVNGFNKLTGKTAEIFTTNALTDIISMSAITGPEDGSVMLNFTVEGSDPEEWAVTCSADGEEDIVETFTGHNVTIKGLTVGKVYTITLGSTNGDQIIGNNSLEFSATRLILAENLTITDYANGLMTVRWDAPADATVEKWTVRCYNDEGHEEVLEIAGTEITFTGIDSTKSYTVEVTAPGMTQYNKVTISANPLTVTDFTVDADEIGKLTVNWTYDGAAPEDGWILLYTFDGYPELQNVAKCDGTSAVIEPRIPGATYHFTIQAADSTSIFGNTRSFDCPNAAVFKEHDLAGDKVTAYLLNTPEGEWTAETIGKDPFTDTFLSSDSISIVLKANDAFNLPKDTVDILYVIRDGDGNVISKYTAQESKVWKDLWYPDNYHNCELNLPKVPSEAGSYSVSIYFNNLALASANFTITE